MKKFAFLIHPRDISDVSRPVPWAKYIPDFLVDNLIKRLPKRFDIYPWRSFDVYGKAEGWIIVVFLTGEQMLTLPRKYVQERILEAVLYAQNRLGVGLVGLGAYTAPLSNAGEWLIRQNQVKINITHGDAFSVAIAAQGIRQIASSFNFDLKNTEIAIIGAYGLIGKALAKLILNDCGSLLLVGRREAQLKKLKEDLGQGENIKISTNINSIVNSDIIVTATSYPGALIKPDHLKKGAVIYDIAQPINVTPEVCGRRPDIIRIDGCYAKIPGIGLGVDMGPPRGATFSCLAETIMQALEGDNKNHVGEIDMAHVKKTIEWQKKYNFDHADFTNFSKPIRI